MKKYLIIIACLTFTILACAQTGIGWYPSRVKIDARDSMYFRKDVVFDVPIRLNGAATGVTTLQAPNGTVSTQTLSATTGVIINDVDLAAILNSYSTSALMRGEINDSIEAHIPTTVSLTEMGYLNNVTSAIQTQINARLNISDTANMLIKYARKHSPTFTGTVSGITATMVGLGNLTNKLQVEVEDSTGGTGHYATWDDMTDGLALKVPYSDVEDEDVELAGGLTSASVTTGGITSTTGIYTDLTVSGDLDATFNSDRFNWIPGTNINGKRYEMEWEVDTTTNAPAAGDSIYTDARFADMHVDVWCSDTVTGQLCLMNENPWETGKYSYEFTDATGAFTFHPKLATAQVVRIVGTNSALWATLTPPAAAYHAWYQIVYNNMTTKPGETIAGYENKFVTNLDTLDYWDGATSLLDRLDLMYVFANEVNSTGEALINWDNPGTYDATNFSGTAWTTLQGYTGDGIADYIRSNFNMLDNSVNYTLNDGSIGIYLRINQQEDVNVFGAYDLTDRISLVPRGTADNYTARINIATATTMTGTGITDASGWWVLTRTAADACSVYHNGSLVETETDVSTAIPDAILDILKTSNLTGYSDNQVSLLMIWDGINHVNEQAALNTIVEDFADDMGFGVQP